MSSYLQDAKSDAQSTAENFLDEIYDGFMDNGQVSDDLNNYSESYHHENHVDRSYSLLEAAELLDELEDYEETDSGLWEGQKPKDAIICQAAYTYGNAVYALFKELIEEINDDYDLEELWKQYENVDDAVQEEYENEEYENAAVQQEECEKRKEQLSNLIKNRISEIIANY